MLRKLATVAVVAEALVAPRLRVTERARAGILQATVRRGRLVGCAPAAAEAWIEAGGTERPGVRSRGAVEGDGAEAGRAAGPRRPRRPPTRSLRHSPTRRAAGACCLCTRRARMGA